MPVYEYSLGVGWDASPLTNVETLLADFSPSPLPPKGSIVYPTTNRVVALSGRAYGSSDVSFTWTWAALPLDGLNELLTSFLTDETATQLTVRHRDHLSDTYTNRNCWAELRPTYVIRRNLAQNVQIAFREVT